MPKLQYYKVSALARTARASVRTNFWCTPLNWCDNGDVFWLLDPIVALEARNIREFENWENQPKKSKNLEILKIFDFFRNFFWFSSNCIFRLFELSERSSSQKTFSSSQLFNGEHQKFIRALARATSQSRYNVIFAYYLRLAGWSCGFCARF